MQVNISDGCYQVDYHPVGTVACKIRTRSLIGSLHLGAICVGSGMQRQMFWNYRMYDSSLTLSCREHATSEYVGER